MSFEFELPKGFFECNFDEVNPNHFIAALRKLVGREKQKWALTAVTLTISELNLYYYCHEGMPLSSSKYFLHTGVFVRGKMKRSRGRLNMGDGKI